MGNFRKQALIAVAAASLTLTACASDDEVASSDSSTATTSSSDSNTRNACALLTKDEAAAALNGPVSDAKAGLVGSGQQASDTCRYELSSDPTTAVQLTILHGSGQVDLFNQQRGDVSTVERQVGGLGDDAFCTKEVLDVAVLSVLKGTNVLQLTGAGCDVLETAARSATPRLN